MNEVVSAILQGNTARISELNATERTVFAQYRNLYQNFKNNSPQATELLQTLLMASIGSSSQVMAFELR
jgi:ABC-type maltose transport system permease subunit